MMNFRSLSIGLAAFAMLASASAAPSSVKESVLHNFGASFDGVQPAGELTFDKAGNLYGVAPAGGTHGAGMVFELSPVSGGWQETVLYNFCSPTNCSNGGNPAGGLVIDLKGNLYGTAQGGGLNGGGVVFELSPTSQGWNEKVLYSFCAQAQCVDGSFPNAKMIRDSAGNLYGTTVLGGGGSNGNGVVFELSRGSHGWNETVLYRFCPGLANCADGIQPWGGLVFDSAGNLYGTTYLGGSGTLNCDKFKKSCGVVYELSHGAGGWTESVLYNFCSAASCADGASPYATLIFDAKGNLYGTTVGGGNATCQLFAHGCGVVFELTPSGSTWTESVLHTFTAVNDGANPYGPLLLDSHGNLSGTTFFGGNFPQCYAGLGCGVVFELTPVSGGGWKDLVRYTFTGGVDGSFPQGGLTADSLGSLYGLATWGGTSTFGVAFKLSH
jgi:uncharacterized repeat protein (TIGR03803 family)